MTTVWPTLAVITLLLAYVHPFPSLKFTALSSYYISKTPSLLIFVGRSQTNLSVKVDLNTPNSFVFGKACSTPNACTLDGHKYYQPTGEIGMEWFDDCDYDDVTQFKGQIYYDIPFEIGEFKLQKRIAVVTEGQPVPPPYHADGRLGLGFGDAAHEVVEDLFSSSDYPYITFKETFFKKESLDPEGRPIYSDQSGAVTIGAEVTGCNDLSYFHITSHDGNKWWQVIADVKVGDLEYWDQRVAFAPSGFTKISADAFNRYFYDVPYEDMYAYPHIEIRLHGRIYSLMPNDYTFKSRVNGKTVYDTQISKVSHLAKYDLLLGVEFLQNYCLVLHKAAKDEFKIGLGQNSASTFSTLFPILLMIITTLV